MSQPIEIALGEIKTVSLSIEKAVSIDITVSQPIEISLGETLLCHSQWRWLL